ncbi:hypothetical protein MBM_04723 [Drepanopeziza brunnea f. sp. 'multigermtubi' MB_m1]|uniref:Uncharacterized protein n=1 Tax=Marssonina brunnea f. sp. multigermtubi (strain MB_m1) TaxID=1072389 RepID=K1WVZ1_MARBU|nr:uncharacterized protein MBM_04723 [Drepanopeziza brunnea f. sp. 'multigermtubi' MB_m1]EKD17146.1 hypothetical protein MBM_04723 [Drepanopeziza brunnea f. sp. 'multigermtubi' MB_m1]
MATSEKASVPAMDAKEGKDSLVGLTAGVDTAGNTDTATNTATFPTKSDTKTHGAAEDEDTSKASTAAEPERNLETDSKAMPPPPPPPPLNTSADRVSKAQGISSSSSPHQVHDASTSQSQSQDPARGPAGVSKDAKEVSNSKEKLRPPFAPFFTLVNDIDFSGEEKEKSTHHPTQVHYIFEDDEDSGVLSAALLRCVDAQTQHARYQSAGDEYDDDNDDDGQDEDEDEEPGLEADADTGSSSSSATFRRGETRIPSSVRTRTLKGTAKQIGKGKGKSKRRSGEGGTNAPSHTRDAAREERIVIVDVNRAGDAVTKIASLTPSWAVLSADISRAPTWDGADIEEGGDETENDNVSPAGGMMLRIEGTGIDRSSAGGAGGGGLGSLSLAEGRGGAKGKGKEKGKGKVEREGEGGGRGSGLGSGVGVGIGTGIGEDEMQSLLESFDRKMCVLRRVVRLGSRESLGGGGGGGGGGGEEGGEA